MKSIIKKIAGFTLVEMAVVLVIFGILLGGLVIPLSAQMDLRDYSKTRTELEQIKEALYGYAVVNGSLPCPDTTGDGVADVGCSALASASTGGNLPWVTLGVQGGDAWGRSYQYRVYGPFTAPFSLSTTLLGAGVLRVCTTSACAATEANNVPAVIYSSGKNGAIQPPTSADELENRTTGGDRTFVSHDFSPTFDDVVVWISPNILFNRMVTAGKLP